MDDTQTLNLAQFPGAANVTGTSDLVITTNQTNMPLPTTELISENFTLDVGLKSAPVEVEYEGEIGLICEGWASKYNETDAAGEIQLPSSFDDIQDTWMSQKEPLVMYLHGLDPILTTRPIGKGVGYKLEPDGLYTKIFIPRDIGDKWQDKRASKKFKELYTGIKNGLITGLSVGGSYLRVGKNLLKRWSISEISIVDQPCLPSARFTLGSKALTEKYGSLPLVPPDSEDQSEDGRLTRKRWSSSMGFARQDGDKGLHDYLLSYEPSTQGKHDSEDCTICSAHRTTRGTKTQEHVEASSNPSTGQSEKRVGDNESDVSTSSSAQTSPSYTEVLKEATGILKEFGQGVKAGRRHSQATRDAVAMVVDHLQRTFQLGANDDSEDATPNSKAT